MKDKLAAIKNWLGQGSINIFGMPFAGKDTHGQELAHLLGAKIIGGGDILRASELEHVKAHIAKGDLMPTDEYLATVLPYLSQKKFKGKPIVLSSMGRWHGEEESVLNAAEGSGHAIKAVLFLSISEAEAKKRWEAAERGREDDMTHEVLLNRFKEFREKTLPVIEFYRQKGLLIEIDGMPPIETVTNDIINKLSVKAK